MKVSLDACLFGAMCDTQSATHILDIGTGTGLLSLMLAQRSHAHIHAVEIDPEAANQAKTNIQQSPYAQQISVFQNDIQSFCKQAAQQYDLIISNPPFFSNQLKNPNSKRRTARHTDALSFEDLAKSIGTLLTPNGNVWILLPPEAQLKFNPIANIYGLHLQKHIEIQPVKDTPSKLGIWVYSRKPNQHIERECIAVYEANKKEYTYKFKGYLRDYYLKL